MATSPWLVIMPLDPSKPNNGIFAAGNGSPGFGIVIRFSPAPRGPYPPSAANRLGGSPALAAIRISPRSDFLRTARWKVLCKAKSARLNVVKIGPHALQQVCGLASPRNGDLFKHPPSPCFQLLRVQKRSRKHQDDGTDNQNTAQNS